MKVAIATGLVSYQSIEEALEKFEKFYECLY